MLYTNLRKLLNKTNYLNGVSQTTERFLCLVFDTVLWIFPFVVQNKKYSPQHIIISGFLTIQCESDPTCSLNLFSVKGGGTKI